MSVLLDLPPRNKAYPEMLVDMMRDAWTSSTIRIKNESVGGTASSWGKNIVKKIPREKDDFYHDLNIIAIDPNDSGGKTKAKRFKKNVKAMMAMILKRNPRACFILVSSSIPNSIWSHAHHALLKEYHKAMEELASGMPGVVEVANLTLLWQQLLERKNFHDLTGNGINHPNDFGHELHASCIARLLGVK